MKFVRNFLGTVLLAALVTACMPYINTSPSKRNHLWFDKYWLGYVDGTVNSNRQLAVAAVYEGAKKTGSEYALYLATQEELRISIDNTNTRDLKGRAPSTASDFAKQDVRNKWFSVKDSHGKAIEGIYEIYDDSAHGVIFLSTNQGLYYKKYNPNFFKNGVPASITDDSVRFSKIENASLKALDLSADGFFAANASSKPLSQKDIDGYSLEVADIKLHGESTKAVLFLATATGLFFSTDLFDSSSLCSDPNAAHWAHIVGAPVIPLGRKDQDYPLATIKGAYKEFDEFSGKMQIKYKNQFYRGDDAWKNDDTNYDPIYDPVYDPKYNRNPDFYAEADGDYVDAAGLVHHREKGQPISWAEYANKQGITAPLSPNSYKALSDSQRQTQHDMRHYYETDLELADYGNPLNRKTGVIRTYAYYRDKTIKATEIKGVSVYDNTVYLATVGGGISYADLTLLSKDLNSADKSTFEKEIVWETYTRNHFHYPALLSSVNERAEENFWSLENIWGKCIIANENGIFYGANAGGIHQASTYQSIRTVRDVNGLAMDYNGNTQCILTKDSTFNFFNQYNYPQLKDHLLKENPKASRDDIANLYYRADKDYHDGITNENLVQGLRLNWKEYTTEGWSIYTAPGDIPPIRLPVLNFPSNQIQKIRFGKLGNKSMIYIATREGLGVAEVRKTFAMHDRVKVPAEVTGDEQYNIDFVDWGAYNKDITTLGEVDFIRDIAATKDADGSDYYIYTATYGQGLVRYHWKSYEQHPFNLDLEELGLEPPKPKAGK